MKIDPTDKLQPLGRPAPVDPAKEKRQGDFASVFEKKIAPATGPGTGPVAIPRSSIMPLAVHPASGPQAVASSAERLVDGLEHYQRLLGDPKATLRELSPVVDDLKRQADDARALSQGLADGDPMKSILHETVLVISQEVERFNQGAYVSR